MPSEQELVDKTLTLGQPAAWNIKACLALKASESLVQALFLCEQDGTRAIEIVDHLIAEQGAVPSPPDRLFHLQWGKRRKFSTTCAATLAALTAAAEARWAVLKLRGYELHHGSQRVVIVVKADLPLLVATPQAPLQVKLTGQSFSKYKQTGAHLEMLAIEMLGLEISGTTGPSVDDSAFELLDFDVNTEFIRGKPAKSMVSVMAESMLASMSVMTEVAFHPGMSQGAFITPVLSLAVLFARASLKRGPKESQPTLSPEHLLAGSRAWGPVDFVIMYRLIAIVVIEAAWVYDAMQAKRSDLKDAWAQLVMQICSVRELMLSSLGGDVKKRKAFQAEELEGLDTYAIICTANTYQLLRFRPGSKDRKPTLAAATRITLPLYTAVEPEVLEACIVKLVLKLAKMVCGAVKVIDAAKERHPELKTHSDMAGLPEIDDDLQDPSTGED